MGVVRKIMRLLWRGYAGKVAALTLGAWIVVCLSRLASPAMPGSRHSYIGSEAAGVVGLPRIGVSDTLLQFQVRRFGPTPPAQTFILFNDYDVGVLEWHLMPDQRWLAVSPDRGLRNEAEIQVWIPTTEYRLGLHIGHVVISSSNAVNSPETVTVQMKVICPIDLTGDANEDGSLTQADIIYLVNHLLRTGPPPQPLREAGDVNCDAELTLSDVIFLVNHILRAGPSPCNACALL